MVDSGTYTPEAIARRLKIAEELWKPKGPVQHWTQGLNQVAESALGGVMLNRAERMEKDWRDQGNAAMMAALGLPAPAATPAQPSPMEKIAGFFGGGGSPAAPPSMVPPPMGAPVPPNKIYGQDEANPLDPPSAADRDRMIRTVYGEAANQGPTGMSAVANVIRNRATSGQFGGDTPGQVVTAPNQFEPWNTVGGRSRMASLAPTDPRYAQIGQIVDQAYGGASDPTNGATHFYAPGAQAALGRNAPAWDNGTGTDIGDHRFFGGAGGPPVTAGQQSPSPVALALSAPPAGGAPTPPGMPPTAAAPPSAAPAPPGAPPAQPAAPAGANLLGDMSADKRRQIAILLSNPRTAPMGQAILQKAMAESEDTNDIKEYQKARSQGFPGTLLDYQVKLKEAGKPVTNINQQQESGFEKESGNLQAKRFDDMVKGGFSAQSVVGDLSALRELGSRISTGKTAEIKATLGPYAEALGLKIDGLSDMQAYDAIIQRMAPQMRATGSGSTSDFEMHAFLKALPGLGKTPEGNEIITKTSEAIQQHKIAAAEIASRAVNHEITRSEAEKQLRALPDPLTLWKKTKGSLPTAKEGAAPSPQPAARPRARNPKTGEELEWDGNKWAPLA